MSTHSAIRPNSNDPAARRAVGLRLLSLLLLLSMACSIPGLGGPAATGTSPAAVSPSAPGAGTPAPEAEEVEPIGTAQTLPPALVETDPPVGAQLSLSSSITFYFNQPMQAASVEAAITGTPALSGSFTWPDEATLVFTPDVPFTPETDLALTIAASAQSSQGMSMLEPVSLTYTTSSYLRLAQQLPEMASQDVDPASAVVAAFNRPVVTLGADPATLPAAFTIQPAAAGSGEWLNTSTYIFYPEPALAGGVAYQVSVNPDLMAKAGSG